MPTGSVRCVSGDASLTGDIEVVAIAADLSGSLSSLVMASAYF